MPTFVTNGAGELKGGKEERACDGVCAKTSRNIFGVNDIWNLQFLLQITWLKCLYKIARKT